MPDIPNPAAIPGILPSHVGHDRDRLPEDQEPHFGNDDDDIPAPKKPENGEPEQPKPF